MFTFNYNEELEKAVYEENLEKVQALLPVGPYNRHRFIKSYQFTLLHYTSNVKIARHLLQCGADVDAKNYKTDETPLFTAITLRRSPDLIRELLNHGASVRARNKYSMNSPLNHAVQLSDCNVDVIKVLLEYGAVVNTGNVDCNTPLNNAVRNFRGNLEIVKLLLRHQSDINAKNLKGNTPLNSAVQNRHCTLSLVKELLKYKAKVNTVNCDGNTPLHYAAMHLPNFKLDIVKLLIKHNARINIENYAGLTALDYAVQNPSGAEGDLSCAKLLIKYTLMKKHSKVMDIKIDHYKGQTYRTLAWYVRECAFEIMFMKKSMVERNLSLYQYITTERTDDIGDQLSAMLCDFIYPIYNDLIFARMKRDVFVDKVVQQPIYTRMLDKGKEYRIIALDTYSVENLAKYLNSNDLLNLAVAFYDSAKHYDRILENLSKVQI